MKDIRHLIIAGIIAIFVIVGFTIVRFLALPESWGKYGHYRADAVIEEMAREPVYQGAEACKRYYPKRYEEWSSGKHNVVNCEDCHGPAKESLINPVITKSGTVTVDRSRELCLRCHLQVPARPGKDSPFPQPQIVPEKHLKGDCFKCHNPHHPDLKPKEEPKEEVVVEKAKIEGVATGSKPAVSAVGKKVYADNCLTCHGSDGQGKTEVAEALDPKPPNLAGKSIDFNRMVNSTTKGKGEQMPAYENELSGEQIKEVTKYIQSLKK